LPELYLKRSDAYLKKGDWRRAVLDFRRATNEFPDFGLSVDRWRQFSRTSDTRRYIDMKSFEARNGSVKLWIKDGNGENDTRGPYKLFRFELNCSAEQIRTLSWAEYDETGNVARTGEGGRWGSVMPDTLGETLEHGACGSS
jgi:hypothetical protein